MALSGMTGFARIEGAHGPWSWAVEARSVNGRNLETRFRGPPGFETLDRVARDGAQARFQRGQLTVNIQAKRAEASAQTQVIVETLERYLKAGGTLCRHRHGRQAHPGRPAGPARRHRDPRGRG
jgi:uncharacterized protein YicC (UPF0701 family)